MGNQPGRPQKLTSDLYNPDLRDWKMTGEGEDYIIWRNNTTSEEVEEYIFTATDAKEFQYMKQVFQFRHDKDYLVASKFFMEEKRAEICSTFYQGHIFIERIPIRLNEIKDIPFPDSLHLLNSALRGFNQLYSKVGSFTVTDHLIGINSDAKIKVWVNSDFGKPNHQGNIAIKKDDQKLMVSEIIEIIDKNIDHRTQPESITKFISFSSQPSFNEAISRLDEYAIKYGTTIPPILNSIAQLRDRGFFKKMQPRGNSLLTSVNLGQVQPNNSPFPNKFGGFAPIYNQIPPPISPVSGYNQILPPINQQVPFPSSAPIIDGSIPLIPVSQQPINTSTTFTRFPTIINNNSSILRPGINYPVRTLPLAKHPHIQTLPPSITSTPIQIKSPNYADLTSLLPTSKIPQSQSIFNSLSYYSHPLKSIPSKIQLTVTKLTSTNSDDRIITNFVLNTKDYPQTSTLDSILYHTEELEKTLNEAVQINPNAVRRNISEDKKYGDGFSSFSSHSYQQSSGWNRQQGHTDPNLLKNALSMIGKVIDSQSNYYQKNNYTRSTEDGYTHPDLLAKTKFTFNQDNDYNRGKQFNNLNTIQDFKFSSSTNNGWQDDEFGSIKQGGTNSDFLSKMKNFDSRNEANNINNPLGSLILGNVGNSDVTRNSSNQGSSAQILEMIKGSAKNVSFGQQTSTKNSNSNFTPSNRI